MPRKQLFEIEDFASVPAWWRDYMTDCLQTIMAVFQPYRRTASILRKVIETSGFRSLVDFGSGAGGPVVLLARELREKYPDLQITLTDKYPNEAAFRRIENTTSIICRHETVSAENPPPDLVGIRTLFTSFHHLPEEDAARVLQSARDARMPLAVFEITGRSLLQHALILFVPLIILLITPVLRPFRWSRIFTTYIIPIVPLGCLWDGIVSNLRTYSVSELRALAKEYEALDYRFEAGHFAAGGGVRGTYLIGLPQQTA